jgi:hypothetical protein
MTSLFRWIWAILACRHDENTDLYIDALLRIRHYAAMQKGEEQE